MATTATTLLCAAALACSCSAFGPSAALPSCQRRRAVTPRQRRAAPAAATTMIFGEIDEKTGKRKFEWNTNTGRSPFGFAENAENWNGRAGMVGFTAAFLIEAVTGKGIITSALEGDFLSIGVIGIGGLFITAITFLNVLNADKENLTADLDDI